MIFLKIWLFLLSNKPKQWISMDELGGGRVMPLVGSKCPNSKMMVLRQFWFSSMNLLGE